MNAPSTQNLPFDLGRGESNNYRKDVKQKNPYRSSQQNPYRNNQQNDSTTGRLNRLRNKNNKYRSKNKKPLPHAETFENEFRNGTAIALKGSWKIAKPSAGLSMFYVWFHFIVRYLAGNKAFASFGMPVKIPGSTQKQKNSYAVEIASIIAAISLFLLLFFAIVILLGIIGIILYMAENKWETLKMLIGEGLKAIWEQIKSVF